MPTGKTGTRGQVILLTLPRDMYDFFNSRRGYAKFNDYLRGLLEEKRQELIYYDGLQQPLFTTE